MRRAASLLCLAGVLLAVVAVAPAGGAQQSGPVVEVFEASGVLDASVLGALRRDLAGAERRGAKVFLIQLSSFGGLGIDPAAARAAVADARVPVAVWVGPRAATAAGTAALLLAGADVVGVSR
jgi:membrane-bound serine protease (ClpP class)